ncbi:hypothetical protein CAPTEDRAFT_212078 [Capitella teleta]|uniref:PD-(D/E)XK endonuclease-like domain-containing protein n=1 Tax=Capitella teleta TaxID=283909 RepID=R7THH3_CAPTE|nr:hypothetical protein CAPTEDRAFT_212078 [Capitella teleta]|eukprot:ELT91026.1 hypothetical protein CAPTEDRAFT_212078 [Capitella teleta]
MVANPCQHYWGDERDPKYLRKLATRKLLERQKKNNPDDTTADKGWFSKEGLSLDSLGTFDNLDSIGNPLLGSMGKLGRDYFHQLHDLNAFDIDVFVSDHKDTLLGNLQKDIFELHDRTAQGVHTQRERDHSLQFHSCHSPLREVEVLYDHLLEMFEQNPELTPKDIVIMLPDIDSYTPWIQAVFGSIDDQRRIPYAISDVSAKSEHPILSAFLKFLELDKSRCTAPELMELMEVPAIQSRFKLTTGDLDILRQWTHESGIRWGLTPVHQSRFDLPELQANSWLFGIRRMLLGYAMPENTGVYSEILPLDSVQGMNAVLAGYLASFIDSAEQLLAELDENRTIEAWIQFTHQLLEHFFLPQSEEDESALKMGLEYNVVFIPFPCHLRKADSPLYHDQQTSETWLALTPSDEASMLSEKERLAEDLRLLYVALTRSVYCCYLGMAPYKSGRASKDGKTDLHLTAIGYLLNQGENILSPDLNTLLEQMAERCEHQQVVISPLPASTLPPYSPVISQEGSLSARNFTGNIERNWWTTSYSALSRLSSHRSASVVDASNEAPGFDTEVIDEQHATQENLQAEEPINPLSLFNFPKGAQPGTFMHSLFEELDMNALRSSDDDAYFDSFLLESHTRAGYGEEWLPAIKGMLLNCLNAPLDGKNLRLMNLQDSARRVEMEFYLPIEKLDPYRLNRLIAQHDPLSARAGELQFHSMKGMLKGFIDLTFEYQGRWYVLDYKSNWLGNKASDYSREAMERVMVEHRYDLQYQLYSLALHRLLRQRIPDYDYDQHFGGAIYLFLRGVQMNDPEHHGIFSHKPSFALVNGLDQLFNGEEELMAC